MNRKACIIVLFALLGLSINAQTTLKVGDKAPAFLLNLQQNSIQSFSMPYLNRIVLIHFWSSSVSKSRANNKFLNRICGRYKNAMYRSAEGFEVIAVAVQSDKKAWNEAITNDSLNNFINGIAVKGYNDDVCKKFGVTQLPNDIMIDENGTIISINPRIRDIENILDERKNFIPVKKEVIGILAQSSNKAEIAKFSKLYLFDAYWDSVSVGSTNDKGQFIFNDIKLNQDFYLKVDNQVDFITSDPLAIYTSNGEFILDGKNMDKGFVFYIPANLSYKLTEDNKQDVTLTGITVGNVNVTRQLIFKNNNAELAPKDEIEVKQIVDILTKNKNLQVNIFAHTDSKSDPKLALEITTKQANTLKNYLVKKGIAATRIKVEGKGNKELRKTCKADGDCDNEEHKINRRVDFNIFKN